MAKTTTITREYDLDGRVVKETIVESGESSARDVPPVAPPARDKFFTAPYWVYPPTVYPGITTNPPYGGWPPGTITC